MPVDYCAAGCDCAQPRLDKSKEPPQPRSGRQLPVRNRLQCSDCGRYTCNDTRCVEIHKARCIPSEVLRQGSEVSALGGLPTLLLSVTMIHKVALWRGSDLLHSMCGMACQFDPTKPASILCSACPEPPQASKIFTSELIPRAAMAQGGVMQQFEYEVRSLVQPGPAWTMQRARGGEYTAVQLRQFIADYDYYVLEKVRMADGGWVHAWHGMSRVLTMCTMFGCRYCARSPTMCQSHLSEGWMWKLWRTS